MEISAITISVTLPGKLGRRVKHTTKQVFSAHLSSVDGKPELLTRKILHTDREMLPCCRKTHISADVVSFWQKGECPIWSKPQVWRKLNAQQRLISYVGTFDEGFGVSFE
ncbi:MAG: hypothetical protein ACOH2V_00500 [Candidatus Saccharimonadaceae bacterium]